MDAQALTIRLERGLYERLRRQAYERHVPQNTIISEALGARLAELEADARAATPVQDTRDLPVRPRRRAPVRW